MAKGVLPLPRFPDISTPIWVAGAVLLATILSIWKTKKFWGPILAFKGKVDKVVHVVEGVTDKVETAAKGVEKVAEEIREHLPDGSELQKATLLVEKTAESIAKHSPFALAGNIIHKIESAEEGLSSLIKKNRGSKEEDDPKQKNI